MAAGIAAANVVEAQEHVANLGSLLRWEAAITELRAFRQVDAVDARRFIERFAMSIRHRLATRPALRELRAPALDRGPFGEPASWDAIATIFPFVLRRRGPAGQRIPLTREQTAAVYRALGRAVDVQRLPAGTVVDPGLAASRCQLGQPVDCGYRDGVLVSALRLCISARLVVEATARDGAHADAVIERALATLDKTAWLVDVLYPPTCRPHHVQEHSHPAFGAEPA
jgi:hypothetical protein